MRKRHMAPRHVNKVKLSQIDLCKTITVSEHGLTGNIGGYNDHRIVSLSVYLVR